MNIFYIDKDPAIAAQGLMDVHIRKMTLETCQLLMTHDTLNGKIRPYRPTLKYHPCRVLLANEANYNWLCRYFQYICTEFKYRFDHSHACEYYYNKFYSMPIQLSSEPNFPQCMPNEFKCPNTIDAYRAYYKSKYKDFMQRSIAKYTKRCKPLWL
jgi:hypothetical protein